MEQRLNVYDEKVLRRLLQLENQRIHNGSQGPLAYVKRNTEPGSAMCRLDELGMIEADYKEGNPYVLAVSAKGHTYLGSVDQKRCEVLREERYRREDRQHDWFISVFTCAFTLLGAVLGFVAGRFL